MLCVGQQLAYCVVYLVALFHCLVFCRQCVGYVFYEQINDELMIINDDDNMVISYMLFNGRRNTDNGPNAAFQNTDKLYG